MQLVGGLKEKISSKMYTKILNLNSKKVTCLKNFKKFQKVVYYKTKQGAKFQNGMVMGSDLKYFCLGEVL